MNEGMKAWQTEEFRTNDPLCSRSSLWGENTGFILAQALWHASSTLILCGLGFFIWRLSRDGVWSLHYSKALFRFRSSESLLNKDNSTSRWDSPALLPGTNTLKFSTTLLPAAIILFRVRDLAKHPFVETTFQKNKCGHFYNVICVVMCYLGFHGRVFFLSALK